MFQAFEPKTYKKGKSLLTISMSLLFFGLIMVNSCVPRSVRHGNNTTRYESNNNESKKEKISSKDEEFARKIDQFSEMIDKKEENIDNFKEENEINSQAYNETYEIEADENIEAETKKVVVKRKIPTLREQMQEFADKQNKIDDKVDLLQVDVNDIKSELKQIKNAILDLEQNTNTRYTQKGPGTPVKQKIQYTKPKKEEYIVLPDNKAEEKPKETKIISSNEIVETESLNNGKKAFESGNIENAIKFLKEALAEEKQLSKKAEAHFYLGESFYTQKNYIQAIENYKQVIAIERAKQKEQAQNKIADSYVKSGNIQEAKNAYAELIANYPNSRFIPTAKKMLQKL